MKKLFALILMMAVLGTTAQFAMAQDDAAQSTQTTTDAGGDDAGAEKEKVKTTKENVIKDKFIEGGPFWMTPVLICLILGLAIAVERIISLNWASINSTKFLAKLEDTLKSGGVEAGKELCRNTKGPIASICYQGLDRTDEGIDVIEKSIESYGSVQIGQLERGLVWISLFIALAPMLGFMGTVIGMIDAFDTIQEVGDIVASEIAGGIKIALLTTVAGLIVAVILQVFYNYLVSKLDNMVNSLEDASISFVDIIIKNGIVKR